MLYPGNIKTPTRCSPIRPLPKSANTVFAVNFPKYVVASFLRTIAGSRRRRLLVFLEIASQIRHRLISEEVYFLSLF